LNDRLSQHVHMHTLYWYLRPFGCAILLAVYDDNGPALYSIAPNGESYKYFATAIGKNKQGASSELESIKFNEITAKEGVRQIARILYKLHDESKDKEVEIELSYITDDTQRRHVLVPPQLRDEAVEYARTEKERAEQGESDEEET
jgi:20S proteasome subunit alpha 7